MSVDEELRVATKISRGVVSSGRPHTGRGLCPVRYFCVTCTTYDCIQHIDCKTRATSASWVLIRVQGFRRARASGGHALPFSLALLCSLLDLYRRKREEHRLACRRAVCAQQLLRRVPILVARNAARGSRGLGASRRIGRRRGRRRRGSGRLRCLRGQTESARLGQDRLRRGGDWRSSGRKGIWQGDERLGPGGGGRDGGRADHRKSCMVRGVKGRGRRGVRRRVGGARPRRCVGGARRRRSARICGRQMQCDANGRCWWRGLCSKPRRKGRGQHGRAERRSKLR